MEEEISKMKEKIENIKIKVSEYINEKIKAFGAIVRLFYYPIAIVQKKYQKQMMFFLIWITIGSVIGMALDIIVAFHSGGKDAISKFNELLSAGSLYIVSLSLIGSVCFNTFCQLFYIKDEDKEEEKRKRWNIIILLGAILLGFINVFSYLTPYKNSQAFQILLFFICMWIYLYEICFEKISTKEIEAFDSDDFYSATKENKQIIELEDNAKKVSRIDDIDI